jgi:hypothetical protein
MRRLPPATVESCRPSRTGRPSPLGICALLGLCLSYCSAALADPSDGAPAAPTVLADRLLDRITAGGVTIEVIAEAFARGGDVRTETASRVTILRRPVRAVEIVRERAGVAWVRERPPWTASLGTASGVAFAAGDRHRASCRAVPRARGAYALAGAARRSFRTEGFSLCRCAAAGLAATRD